MNKGLLREFNRQWTGNRKRGGITVYRLAQETGVSQQTIHRWRQGLTVLSVDNAEKLAKALNVKIKLERQK